MRKDKKTQCGNSRAAVYSKDLSPMGSYLSLSSSIWKSPQIVLAKPKTAWCMNTYFLWKGILICQKRKSTCFDNDKIVHMSADSITNTLKKGEIVLCNFTEVIQGGGSKGVWGVEFSEIWHITSSWRHQSMKKGQFLHICKFFSPIYVYFTWNHWLLWKLIFFKPRATV